MEDNKGNKEKLIALIAIAVTIIGVIVMLLICILTGGKSSDRNRASVAGTSNQVVVTSPSPSPSPTSQPYQKEDFDEHKGNLTSIPDELGSIVLNDIDDYYHPDELSYTIEAYNDAGYSSVDNAYVEYDIDYPAITFKDGRNANDINDIIKSYAYNTYNHAMNTIAAGVDDGNTYTQNVDYQITYASDSVMCVIFSEYYTFGNIYLEYYDLSSVVIDMQNGSIYRLNEVLGHNKALDKLYYDKLITESTSLMECSRINMKTVGHTIEAADWVEDRYKSVLILTGGGITLGFTYHYNDGNRLLRGWTTVNFSIDELKDYFKSSDLWERFPG